MTAAAIAIPALARRYKGVKSKGHKIAGGTTALIT
jgi:hypothetical protein